MKKAIAVLLFTLAATALAQSKAQFVGTWKLNAAKSDLGGDSGPRELIVKVERCDTVLKYAVSGTTQDGSPIEDPGLDVPIDGKDHSGPGGQGVVNFKWDGPVLAGEMRSDSGRVFKVRVLSSEDGKTITREVEIKGDDGFKRREVYERQ